MALIKFGDMVSGASGSIEGTTYSRNRYGSYVRNRAMPVNPNTSRQQAVRAYLSQLAQRWKDTLTQAQRDAWDVYAANVSVKNALGDDIFLTGFNHYIRSNSVILQCGLTIVDDGPTTFSLPELDSTITVSGTADDQKVSIGFDDTMDWLDEDGGAMAVIIGLPQDSNINFFGGPYRFADSIDGDAVTPPTTPTELDSPYQIANGQKIWAECRIVRADGRVSNPFRASGSVAAS